VEFSTTVLTLPSFGVRTGASLASSRLWLRTARLAARKRLCQRCISGPEGSAFGFVNGCGVPPAVGTGKAQRSRTRRCYRHHPKSRRQKRGVAERDWSAAVQGNFLELAAREEGDPLPVRRKEGKGGASTPASRVILAWSSRRMANAPFETKTMRVPSGEIAACESSSGPCPGPIVRMADLLRSQEPAMVSQAAIPATSASTPATAQGSTVAWDARLPYRCRPICEDDLRRLRAGLCQAMQWPARCRLDWRRNRYPRRAGLDEARALRIID